MLCNYSDNLNRLTGKPNALILLSLLYLSFFSFVWNLSEPDNFVERTVQPHYKCQTVCKGPRALGIKDEWCWKQSKGHTLRIARFAPVKSFVMLRKILCHCVVGHAMLLIMQFLFQGKCHRIIWISKRAPYVLWLWYLSFINTIAFSYFILYTYFFKAYGQEQLLWNDRWCECESVFHI